MSKQTIITLYFGQQTYRFDRANAAKVFRGLRADGYKITSTTFYGQHFCAVPPIRE
jgi:hypothetical protein